MSALAGHHLRLSGSALRLRTPPRIRPRNSGKCLLHEPHHFSPRIHLHCPGQRRQFGVASVAEAFLRGSELLVTNTHAFTGTPWFISIPLVALVVNAAIRTPLTLYTHNMARKRARLMPLIQAQTAMVGLGLRKKAVPNLRERVSTAMKKRTKDMFRAFAINEWMSPVVGILSLPFFLSNLEVIRRMCGGPRGLLGSLVFGASGAGKTADTAMGPTDGMSASSASAVGVPAPADLGDLAASGAQDALASISLDPSFATGGCLWFPSLLEADPYHILPFAVSAILVLHMLPESSPARRELFGLRPVAGDKHATLQGQTRGRRGFQRTMLIAALAIGPVTMDLPAALHIYWLASAGFSFAVSRGLKIVMPLPKNTVKPCRGMEVPLLRPKPT